MRRSCNLLAYKAAALVGTGIYDEDLVNDYTSKKMVHANRMMTYYGRHEHKTTMRVINHSQNNDSRKQHDGLNPINGHGAFEREMERKGIEVEKYPLPNTKQATRVREMTLLRRLKLEEASREAMAEEHTRLQLEKPSAWYDETKGPLNRHYLKFVKSQYSKVDVTDLPNEPIRHASLSK